MSRRSSFLVAGAGVFGSWIAYTLRTAGHAVTLLDPFGPAHSRSSSGGESRIIRAGYGSDEIYTRMAQRSLTLWESFLIAVGRRELFQRTGVLWLAEPGDAHAEASRISFRKNNIDFEDLSVADLRRRYSQINVPLSMGALFEKNAGALMARQAVQAIVNEFVRIGGIYRHGALRSPELESASADVLVYACGPWLATLFPGIIGPRLFVTRQEVLFFGVPPGDQRFQPTQLPIWLDFGGGRGMYGFPDIESRGIKLACDNHGPPIDPDKDDRLISPTTVQQMRTYLGERFPALADAPLVEARVCQYENTSNGDFIIDRHPALENAWLVGGGSGHGFKHGPAVAEYLIEVIAGAPPEPRFALSRKATKQSRKVY
jgi:sarcosine oxidase